MQIGFAPRWAARAVWLAVAMLLAVAGLSAPARATVGATVREWNLHAINALFNAPTGTPPGAGQFATVAQLHLAMVHGAVYDAVNAIDGGHEPYLSGLPAAPSTASVDAAAATAAHHVLVGLTNPVTNVLLLPQVTRDWLDVEYGNSLAAIPDVGESDGIAIGAAAAAAMLEARDDDDGAGPDGDGRFVPFTFSQDENTPGKWRPTLPAFASDPFAWVAFVDPFVLQSPSQFRTDGPLSMTSAEYAEEYNEVKLLGSNAVPTARTPEQTAVANFYNGNSIELWNRTFRTISDDENLTVAEEARLFAMLNVAAADAVINCWNDKEFYSFWRPITAIRLGDTDENAATERDTSWTPLFGTPPYPDHPSGFNCLTGAYMQTAKRFFGSNQMTFEVDKTLAGPTRTYDRFTDVVHDTIDARVYLGIHFRTPDVQGAVLGKQVAQWLDANFFEPV